MDRRADESLKIMTIEREFDPDATVVMPEPVQIDTDLAQDEVDPEQQHTFLAFGAGPRKCPGELLAFLEASIVLARLLRSYVFSFEDAEPVETLMQLTLVASHLRLNVRRV